TYTDISSPFEELSDIGSPRADDHEHLMLPEMLEDPYVEVALLAPPSQDYIPGHEEPEQAPPSPDYVPGPEHADDEVVVKDQPYAEDASPIAQSPEYVPESDFEAHPEDDDDEDPAEDPVDYPADGGVAPTATDQASSAEETEPFETDESAATQPPHPAYRTIVRISIPAPVPMLAWTNSEVVRLLAISSPPASPLSPWSSPPPQIPFPPLPPILSPPSPIPSTSRMEDRPEVTLPPRKRLDITLGPRYEVGECSSAAATRPAGGFRADYDFVATVDREIMRDPKREVGYRITNSWDEIVETLQGAPVSTDTELDGHVREFETRVRQDIDDIYMRLDDEQTERHLLAESDLVHGEVMSLRTTVLGQMSEIRKLQDADRRRQTKPMAPRRTTRSTADQETVNAIAITNAQLQAMIDQGVTAALAARDALTSTNGDDSHNSAIGVRRTERATRECTYIDFLKCQPLPFKGTKGVVSLSQWVVASKPKTMQEAIEIATELMDKKVRTFTERETTSKRKRECPKLKNNNNHGNQSGRNNASVRVYAVGRAGTEPDANDVTADRRIIGLNTILGGCTLNLLNHPFNIDLMPVELGSFDAIIDMEWLAKYQAVIVCAEKIVRIPWGNE
nr:reverse transcriptase domain-containing protein [Tanacetum cinerariifolium]